MKKFIGSVGRATLFGKKGGNLEHIADVNTLTESTLGFSSSMEEIRAGQGAKLYGRFNHSAGMTVALTDAMFDLEYVARQVGTELQNDGIPMFLEKLPLAGGKLTLSKPAEKMGTACGMDKYIAWYRKAGCGVEDAYDTFISDATFNEITVEGGQDGDEYCVRYFTREQSAKSVLVNANFVPAELVLVLTTKLYAGDANAPETGKPVGEITIKVPRFQLDGTFDLSMAMSSAATVSLNGTALAVETGDCEDEGIYAEIVEVLEGADWKSGLQGLIVDGDNLTKEEMTVGYEIVTYAVYKKGLPAIVDPSLLDYSEVGGTGAVINGGRVETAPTTAGTITIKIKDATGIYEDMSADITVTE